MLLLEGIVDPCDLWHLPARGCAQPVAYAGYHANSFVSVYKSSTGGSAYGSMQSARYYSSDTSQYIGCLSASDLVSSTYITCAARNAQNVVLTCYSTTASGQARQAVAEPGLEKSRGAFGGRR